VQHQGDDYQKHYRDDEWHDVLILIGTRLNRTRQQAGLPAAKKLQGSGADAVFASGKTGLGKSACGKNQTGTATMPPKKLPGAYCACNDQCCERLMHYRSLTKSSTTSNQLVQLPFQPQCQPALLHGAAEALKRASVR